MMKWGIDEQQIREEMDRQEMSNEPVTLLFAMKWFYSDLFNKGLKSKLLQPILSDNQGSSGQVKSESELMTLCYLSYLETNNYLKSNQKYLFGELVKSSKSIYQEQVFLFLEMLKVFFPGGDSLVSPNILSDIEKQFTLGKGNQDEVSIKLLSRVFSMTSFEDAGINLSQKQKHHMNTLPLTDFDIS